MDNAVEDYGFNTFTEEEAAALMEQAEDACAQTLAYFVEDYKSLYAGFMDDETAQEMARDYLHRSGCTVDGLYQTAVRYAGYDRLYAAITDAVVLSDEEVQAYYLEHHAEPDRALFEDDIEQYERYTGVYGQTVYYIPDGYRAVSQIFLSFPEDVLSEIDVCRSKMEIIRNSLEDAAEAERHLLIGEMDNLQAQILSIREKALPRLQGTLDEIQEKLAAGESFDSLIALYGEDEEMLDCPQGYMVHAQSIVYEAEFCDAAMALKQIGDVSEPVVTNSGVHLIRYLSDVPEGMVELSGDAFEAMAQEAAQTRKDEVFQAAMDEWGAQYSVTVFPELIELPDAQ